jgi:transcription initiation factor TFIIB
MRPFNVLCAASEMSSKQISRYYQLILEEMDITLNPVTHSHYNRVFCIFLGVLKYNKITKKYLIKTYSSLGLPAIVQRAALYIGSKAEELDIVPGCSAVSVAAAAIYMASNASDKKLTKKEVCDVTCGVKESTIGKSYELMYPHAAELFPEDFELDINQLPKS